MPYPAKLGQPCWEERQVEKVLGVVAKVSDQSVDAFLAAHSPFRFVRNARDPLGRELSEEEVFELIFGRYGEVQAAIKGEPGTGKSHFVHWLKLRLDFQAEHGDQRCQKFVRILVQRGNGSLKDALRQIVERLGEDFREHLRQLQGAIDKMTAENARATLLAELGLEISPRWGKERPNRPPFPKGLKQLAPALRSEGVQRWLLRQGGVIDQIVRRLTDGAAPSEQDSWPEFTVDELSPPSSYLSLAETSEDVREFFLTDLPMEPQLRLQVAEVLNIARSDAVASLTGLSGVGLREIFDNIRRDLRKHGRELALFIEDVSVTGLDREVINALEPQERDDLCRMVAVIGITSNAWRPLEENQQGRFDPVFEVGAGVTERWSSSSEEVAHFTARYLNTIRSTDDEISIIAEARREQNGSQDISISKCGDCPQREVCHKSFGYVSLPGDVRIGLFPFTLRAPQSLLTGLSEDTERTGVRRSQRGLIENVLIPVLQSSRNALENREFPRPASLPVRMTVPRFWTGFTHKYLGGGWDSANKDRVQLLSEYWVNGSDADEVASQMQPLLKALGLPNFAQMPIPVDSAGGAQKQEPTTPPPTPSRNSSELQRKLQALENWSRNEPLKGDGEFRDMLKDFFNRSIPWPDQRDLPIVEIQRLVGTNKFPRIEGQGSNPVGQPCVYILPRNLETRELLDALVHFSVGGRGSWDFDHGELHKRNIWRWLNRHRQEVLSTLKPGIATLHEQAVNAASRALAITAILRDRKALPKDPEERLSRLLMPIWKEEERPVTLTIPLRQFIDHLELRNSELREFLLAELGGGQGWFPAKDYLDPRPLLEMSQDQEGLPGLSEVTQDLHQGFWQKRFNSLRGLGEFSDLADRLRNERNKASEIIAGIRAQIEECGGELNSTGPGFEKWLAGFTELIELQRGTRSQRCKLDVPNPSFDAVWEKRLFQLQVQREKAVSTLVGAEASLSNDSEIKWLTFDPQPLSNLKEVLDVAHMHLHKIDKIIGEMEEHYAATGGGDRDALISELDALSAVFTQTTSDPNTESDHESK